MADPKEPSTSGAPKLTATSKPAVRSPDSDHLSDEANRAKKAREPRVKPVSGGAAAEPDPLRNPIANRNTEGPRHAGVTPRPTDKPVE
jgi:hypothetical protein